jgi:alkylation response protein AidB-like acyl-CoA dehydrogenase
VATEHQIERWLRPTVCGEGVECYAITEEGAGTDVDAIEATARREADEYVLDGVKWHVTSYNEATWGFFQAKLTEGAHAGEHAMFIFDIPTPGLRVVRTPAYTHTINHHHPILAFEGVRVPTSNLVGEEGGGMAFAYEWFRFERFMVAARCLGAAERLIEEATSFAKERVASGRPIIEHQLIQAMLADSLTELFAARSMLYTAATAADDGVDTKVQHAHASMAKLYASEMAGRVADRALQIFGGRGYMRENVAERFWRELRVERIWEGTSEIQRTIISEQLAKRGAAALV